MPSLPKITYIYDRYNKATSKKEAAIELRVTYNRKQKYISTGIDVLPKEWKKNAVVGRGDAQQLNQQLDQLLIDVRQIIIDMQREGDVNIFAIPERLKKLKDADTNLLTFIRQRTNIREYGKSKDTKERYERFIRLFKKYGQIKDFSDITESKIISYDRYLASTGMKPYSKWNNYHRFLNSFIMDAIDEGLMKKNPYKWINIDKENDNETSRYLTPAEFKRIQNAKLPTESLEKVRDVFVFQTYTCLSYSDLRDFSPEKTVEIKGMKVYTGKRDKTGKQFTIPLLQPALEILRKYNDKLPIISNVKYNEYLKVVAQAAGIDKPVSTHWARHTGATMLLNEGIPMQIVSKICGHSSTRMTEQVYAKLLDETVVEAVKKLKNDAYNESR